MAKLLSDDEFLNPQPQAADQPKVLSDEEFMGGGSALGPVGQFAKKAIGAATEAVGAALGAKYGKTHAGYGEEPAAGPLEQPASQAELAAANANPANAAANAAVLDTNPQRLVADAKAKADAQRYMRGDGAGDLTAAPERGPFQRALDATVRKPMDGSLAGLAVETAGDAARGASRGVYGIVGSGYSALQAGAEALGQGGDVSGFAGEAGKVARQDAGQMSNPSDPNSITQQVFESATTNLAPIGAFGAGNKALVAMGAQAAAGDYGQSRDNGLSHEDATGRAAFMGAAEVIGEKVGMPALGKLLAGAAGRVGYKELGHLIADHAFKEQVGEQATTLLQDAYEKWGAQGRQPGMTLENYLEDVANTAKVTLGQSLLMAGGAATIRKASDAMPGANDRMLGQALADDIQQAPPLAQGQLDRAATGLLAPGATPVDSQPRSGVMLAGRAVESFTDQQLQRYAKSGVLTSAVQSKVDAELARRGAAAPAQQPATPASTGEQLDSAVQRYADGAGIGQPAEPGAGQQPADAGRGAGDASAPDGQPEGGVRADAGSPAGSVREGAPDALGGAQRQVALGDGSVIPAPIGDPLAHNVQQRQEAINDVTSQQKERDAYVPEPNAANNFQRANDTLRAAGVRGGPTFAGDGPDVATREVHDFNVGGVGNSAGLAVGQQHLADYIKQQADRGVTVEPESLPNLSPIRDARLAREAQTVADVLHAVTGVQHYMFDDQRQGAADGLTYRGRSYVNAGNLEQSLPFTAWHETFHAAEQRAARGDASAKKFVQVFNSIFDDHIKDESRAKYISTHPEFQGKSLADAMAEPELARKLKSEMMADFLGKRGDDMKWLRHVAQKNPAGFGGFIRTWIDRLTNLIDEFKAKRNLGNRDVDQYIRKLSHAKAVAASAFIEWRNANKAEAEKLPQAGGTNTLSRSLKLEPHQVLSPETLTAASQLGWKMNKPLSTLTPEMRAKAEGMLAAPARLAAEAKQDFDRKVTNIAEQLGGDAQLAPVKGLQRAAEKLAIDYRYEVSRIGDMLRASIVVPTLQEVPQAIRAVGQNFDVVGIKDRFTDPTESGYRDMLVNVRLPNGLRAEIQVHIPEMLAAKKVGHKAYEVQREIEAANPTDQRLGELYALQSRIYGEAYDKAQARLRDSSSASMERNTDSLTGVAAEKVSDALNGRLSGSNAKQEPSGSLATGTSSQSKNLVPAGNSGESIAHSKKDAPIVGQNKGSQKSKTDSLVMVAERGERAVGKTAHLSGEEKQAIAESADKTGVSEREIRAVVTGHKMANPVSQGWAPLNFKRAQFDKKGKIEYVYQPVPYTFSSAANAAGKSTALKPGTPEYTKRVNAVAKGMADEVRRVYQRAQDGDKNAQNILAQAGWYKKMRSRLRHEFGGMGDLFADLLGATSPNTPVRDNWYNAVDSLRRASRGDFDGLMGKWSAWASDVSERETALRGWFNERLAEGLSKKAIMAMPEYTRQISELQDARKLGDDMLPTKESGKKYGFNGGNVISAMVDLWRTVQDADADLKIGGTAPKALNFSGNLIGFRQRATIDVWAARMLQRLSGGARIPSMAETGVSGNMRSDASTTLQFGFGQDVFSEATKRIRKDAEMKTDPTLAAINDDDLQAVVWFVEKELWTVNNWTNAAGEGGSFELEASLTGSKEQERIKLLRKFIDSKLTSPKKKAESRAELATLERTVDRYTGGLSMEMSLENQGVAYVPTDSDMAQASNRLRTAVYESDDSATVMGSKILSTEGRRGAPERSFDIEVSARENYSPATLWRQMLTIAQEKKQDATFLSRVLREGEEYDPLVHRPGVEIYFRDAKAGPELEKMLAELDSHGVSFLTIIADTRRSPTAMAGAMPAAVGVRMQFVPEFLQRYGIEDFSSLSEAELVARVRKEAQDMQDLAETIESKVEGVSYASMLWHETQVAFGHEYQEKIDGITAAVSEREPGSAGGQGWAGHSIQAGLASADRQLRVAEGGEPAGRGEDAPVGGVPESPSQSTKASAQEVAQRHFAPEAITKAEAEPDSKIVEMTPQEFLGMAEPGFSKVKQEGANDEVARGDKFDAIPELKVTYSADGTGRITYHDGRHRMRALDAAGAERVPVLLYGRYEGKVSDRVGFLAANVGEVKSQDGSTSMDLGGLPSFSTKVKVKQVLTPTFRAWFGEPKTDSNLVNDDGSPMVLYHGTTKSASRMEQFRRSTIGAMGPGVYLGDSAESSAGYDQGAMMKVYARGKYLTNAQWTEYVNKHGWKGAEDAAKADGWAGVRDSKYESAVAVWDPANIKSATDNNGEFSNEDSRLNFSPKQRAIEDWATKAMAGKAMHDAPVVPLTNGAPHPAFTMMGAGRDQPFVLDMEHARHIANTHPDITPRLIAELPELMKKPRAILMEGPGRLDVFIDRRDGSGNPIKVAMRKGKVVAGRQTMLVTEVQSVYGRSDSLRNIVDVAQMKTGAVWLPSVEVSRAEDLMAGRLSAPQKEGGDPSVALSQSPATLPRSPANSVPGAVRTLSTGISVYSDAALAKFTSASPKGWAGLKTTITVPRGADLDGLSFSRKFTSEVPEETKTEGVRRQAQDQHIRMRTLREWAAANGVAMSAASDVYTTEERMHGRQASRIEDFREKRVKPLVEKLQKSGHTLAQVEEYLQAQHAEERNRAVAKINKTMPDGGSGMPTADARAILQAAPASLKAIANEFQAITTDSRNTLLRSGIISQDMADAWDKAYKHYVPLKGGDDEDAGKTGQGKGLSVNGKQKRAMGHSERDENIIENILRDHERAIMLAEKNRVGQAMLLWLTEMNDPRIGTVDKPVKRAVLMPSYQYDVRLMGLSVQTFDTEGQARNFIMQQIQAKSPGAKQLKISKTVADQNVQYMANPMLQPNEAQVYVNGSAVRLQLNDELLAQSYKRLGSDQMSRFIASARAVNTYLSKAYTGYNPAFIPRNLIRDFGSGLVKITGNFGAGITTSTLVNYPAAMGSLLKYSITGKSTPLIDEYRAHGGSTGAAYLGDLDRIGRNIRDDFERYQGVMAQLRNPAKTGRERAASAARVASQKVIGGLIGWIEHLNMATENAMRVAVFKAVKDSGASIEEAASAAKNSTVNFNRKGELGQTMSALYLFYNPNVQDTASVIETFTRGKHRGQAAVLVSAMIGLSYALAAMQFGGDDDDYKAWKEIPDNVRDKNLVLRTGVDDKGKQTYVKIPVPFGFGFFHTLANSLFMAQKGESVDRLSVGVASNLASHFSPMGNPLEGVTSWRKVSPVQVAATAMPGFGAGELGRDALKLVVNKNSFGSEIYPESPFDSEKPDFLKMYRGTKGSVWDTLATGMSKATGGTATQAGMVDVSPETLKFWNSAITGGTGTFLYDIAHVTSLNARYYANPDDPHREALNTERGERPILRDYLGEVTVKDARRAFWDAAKDADSVVENFKRAQKGRDVEAMKAIREDNKEALQLADVADGFKKLVKAKRDRVDQINADTTTSLAFKRAAMAEVERAEQASYDKFVGIVIGKEHKRAERLAGSN